MFTNLVNPIDWKECVYFDVETVSTIDEMRTVASKELTLEAQLNYLNPKNAKYFAVGVFTDNPLQVEGLQAFKMDDRVVYYNTEPFTANEIADAVLCIADAYNRRVLVAHNGKKFDFLIFLNAMHDDYLVHLRFQKHSYYLQCGRKYYRLVDTMDLAKAMQSPSLDKLSKLLGIGEKNLKNAETLQDYNVNDVLLLMDVGLKFKELGFQYTPTATARSYVNGVMEKIGITKIKQFPEDLGCDYVGGRTEVFYHKGENLYCYDANSLYPSVMAHFEFPKMEVRTVKNSLGEKETIGVVRLVKLAMLDCIKKRIDKYNATIWNPEPCNPFELKSRIEKVYGKTHVLLFVRITGIKDNLPEHAKQFAQRYFPFSYFDDGRRLFRFNPERIYQVQSYETAFLHFFEYEIVDGYYFYTDKFFLADEMQELYKERQKLKAECNLLQYFYKIVMNSSYGIFGLRDVIVQPLETYLKRRGRFKHGIGKFFLTVREGRKQGTKGIIYEDTLVRLQVFTPTESGAPQLVVARDFSVFSLPIFAITITSHARFWLHAVIYYLIRNGYKVFYCDTDSVFTDAPAVVFQELSLLGKDMLQWKMEYEIDRAYFFVPKCYALKAKEIEIVKAKGVGSTFVTQRTQTVVNKDSTKITNFENRVIERVFIKHTGFAAKIPDLSTPNWESKWNDDNVPSVAAFDHLRIIEFLKTFSDEKYVNDYLLWLKEYKDALEVQKMLQIPESAKQLVK